jgi:hypothetical protein
MVERDRLRIVQLDGGGVLSWNAGAQIIDGYGAAIGAHSVSIGARLNWRAATRLDAAAAAGRHETEAGAAQGRLDARANIV